MYANVCIDISHSAIDRPFSYYIPKELEAYVKPGTMVDVPFGSSDKLKCGYVTQITDKSSWRGDKIKAIHGIHEGSVNASERLIALAAYIKERFGSTMIAAIKTVTPVKRVVKRIPKKRIIAIKGEAVYYSEAEIAMRKRQWGKERLLRELAINSEIDYSVVTGKLGVSAQTVNSLVKQDLIKIINVEKSNSPFSFKEVSDIRPVLSDEQSLIVEEISENMQRGIQDTYLVKGITGSGKTEVYMSLIERCINNGGQAIMLIPEISLTYQNLLRFYRRFGDRVSVIHSKMSEGERFDQFERVKKNEVSIMIGPRSALFTPFENLKLIIIDEEHEASYKSESVPKYDAIEVAQKLAQLSNASLVLGSATPSVKTYYRALSGQIKMYKMTKRLTGGSLPTVHIVDMKEELKDGNKSVISSKLDSLIEDRMENGEQVMLFLNRRGYAGFVSCRSCGNVIKCPHCDVSLSEHGRTRLVCHYCGYEIAKPKACPICSSNMIGGFKAGTEQIEEIIRNKYPQAVTIRMDADTTTHKDDYEQIITKFNNHEANVLIGTQMIVKGHDFKDVTLMGVIAADMSLFADDYRAGEKTFELLTQAAGRAGRGEKPGEVVIQTYQPDNYAIVCAKQQDYEAFYEEEIMYRMLMNYPPVSNLLCIMVTGPQEKRARGLATRIVKEINAINYDKKPVVLGPSDARIAKVNDIFRKVIYIKNRDYGELVRIKDRIEEVLETLPIEEEKVYFDFNPVNAG